MDPKNLAGSLKVAILVQSLGEEESGKLLGAMSGAERELIMSHLSQMGPVSLELVEKIAKEFIEMGGMRRPRVAKDTSKIVTGDENGGDLDSSSSSKNLEILRSIEPDQLYELIKDEHPQTIAVIIVHLETRVASNILSKLPDEIKTDVAFRIASLDKVISGMVEEIGRVFEDILKAQKSSVTHKTGGVDRLAEILNLTDGMTGEQVLEEIEEQNPELAAQIKQKMFIFEDILLVDDRGFQKVLRKIETRELAMALKGASEDVKDKVFGNMSERAKEMLIEEIEALGPVRMKEVEDAQQSITSIVQDMENKGEIIISGRKGDDLIV